MDYARILCTNLVSILAVMLCMWLISLKLRDVSIVDIGWGLGFVMVAWVTNLLAPGGQRSFWLIAMTTIWGLRLSAYLAWRNLGKPEDYRYRAMRERYGRRFPWISLFLVFALQGMIMWIVSWPVQIGQSAATKPQMMAINYVGAVVWLVGWLFETVGDYQLARFKGKPENQGKVMDRGLWRYTRHPNYFGDFLVWWGIFIVSIDGWQHVWTVVSPVLMSILLWKVSGVALLERNLKKRSPDYVDYVSRTSSFFPRLPRASAVRQSQ